MSTVRALAFSEVEVEGRPLHSFDTHDPLISKRAKPGVIGGPVETCFDVYAGMLVSGVNRLSLGTSKVVDYRVSIEGD